MIRIDGDNIRILKKAYVVVKRNGIGKIKYNSGLVYIYAHQKLKLPEDYEQIEVNLVSGNNPPEEDIPKGKIYCPYCRQYEEWQSSDGYKVCPICGMTNMDFYVKKFNGGNW